MARSKDHVPIRKCISCGARKRKRELIRLVLNESDQVVRDENMNRPGRGAYVCVNKPCIEKIIGNKGLNRIFRTNRPVTVGINMEHE